jgi:hypothetical protein
LVKKAKLPVHLEPRCGLDSKLARLFGQMDDLVTVPGAGGGRRQVEEQASPGPDKAGIGSRQSGPEYLDRLWSSATGQATSGPAFHVAVVQVGEGVDLAAG